MVLTKASLPKGSPHLGALFGLNETCASLARAIGPTLVSTVFAISTKHAEVLGGYSIWVGLMGLGAAGVWMARRVKDIGTLRDD